MALITFNQWIESSASTRARREIALGLRTPTGMGSLHGHSTAAPWETKSIKEKTSKKKRKNHKKDKKQ